MRILQPTFLYTYILLLFFCIPTIQAAPDLGSSPPPYFRSDDQKVTLISSDISLVEPTRAERLNQQHKAYIYSKNQSEKNKQQYEIKRANKPRYTQTSPQNTGFTQTYRQPENLSIRVIGLAEGMVMLRVNRKPYNLRNGESTPHGIKLIQADSEDAILEINGKRQKYGLNSGIQTSQISLAGGGSRSKKSISFYKNREGFYISSGFINGVPVKFDIRSNVRAPIILHSHTANQLGIEYKHGVRVEKQAFNRYKIYKISLKNITIKNHRFYNVEAWVYESNDITQDTIPLSQDLLKHLAVSYNGYTGSFATPE